MSLEKKEILKCPKCGKENSFRIWDSVNTTENPEMKRQLITGEMFRMVCEECGAVTNVNYRLLYHDTDRHFMIQYVPDENEADEVIETFEGLKQMAGDIYGNYTLRITGSVKSLREKVYIAECGLDDRIVEIMKMVLCVGLDENGEEHDIEEMYLEISEAEPAQFAVKLSDGSWGTVPFSRDIYDKLFAAFAEKADHNPNKYVVNFEWAAEFMRLCSEGK